MKLLFISFFTSLLVFSQALDDRIDKDKTAQKVISELNFFAEGRGMYVPSPLTSVFEPFSYLQQFRRDAHKGSVLKHRYGVNLDDKGNLIGIFDATYDGVKVKVLGCVFCHSSKVAGEYIIGVGNKNVDVGRIGEDLMNIMTPLNKRSFLNKFFRSKTKKRMHKETSKFFSLLANEKISNLTQGMVPISMIRAWFYNVNGLAIPYNMPRGAVKVPHLWGYGEKRKVGQFADGGGDGQEPGWGIAVELAAGQDYKVVQTEKYLNKIHHAENIMGDLLPPKYPFEIDNKKSLKGRKLFENHCLRCHGDYQLDANKLPIYKKPKFIPLKIVKTDQDRLVGNTPEFYELVANNPLNYVMKAIKREKGYFAPRLEGIWSRFPYLHNGSVPTLFDILSRPNQRPVVFSLKDAGERYMFDETKVGLVVKDSYRNKAEVLKEDISYKKRGLFDTRKVGHSNVGHENFPALSNEQKYELIEYLKTL